ncbi:MAG: glycosyltransferase family 2 protein [Gammaproteobacteria bacterium]
MQKSSLSIVIPVFNEELNLPILKEKIIDAMEPLGFAYEVLLVNDGSTDSSESVMREIASENTNFKAVNFRKNYGQTAAMMAGIDYATGDIIIPMDADLQNDPADIGRLVEKLEEGFDVVSGWRADRQDNAISRNLPSRWANKLISKISGVKLHDYGCSLKAYRKDVIKDVRLYGEMHRFIPIYASWLGGKVTEIPVKHYARIHGESKYGLERVVKVILDLMVVKFLADYANKPIYIFGGFGVINICISFVAALVAIYLKLIHGVSLILTPLPLFSALTFITGMMSILMGLLAELIMRTYHESQDKKVYSVKNTLNLEQQ